jgi:cysteinyl-tRNA synthetase
MLKLKNTLTGKKEEFKPLDPKVKKVSMYVCGPTVYDLGHLGHGRSAVCFDVIRRYLLHKGYDVEFISNYTDIDDKMINRAREEGVAVPELAERIIPTYEEDYAALGILPPDESPRATEYIDEMIEFIGKMEEAGVTYVIEGDGVYFDVSKAGEYGKLSGQKLEELKIGARVKENVDKRNPYDFVVWKFAKEGEPKWSSPWGDGRPGWHLECSVMSWKLLGERFDIHGGGGDLTFPHHECEIAQSESVFGKGAFAQYWMHNGFITINKEKMSKSLGNFFTLRDILGRYDGQVVRLMFLQTHYGNPIEFSEELLDQAKASLARVHDFVRNLKASSGESEDFDLEPFVKKFEDSMNNDFDTSGALGAVFDLIKYVGWDTKYKKAPVLKLLEIFDDVFDVIFAEEEPLAPGAEALIKEREEARADKDFDKADKIRNDLLKKGIEIEDTPNGTVWKKV